jgi:hypothetical protein
LFVPYHTVQVPRVQEDPYPICIDAIENPPASPPPEAPPPPDTNAATVVATVIVSVQRPSQQYPNSAPAERGESGIDWSGLWGDLSGRLAAQFDFSAQDTMATFSKLGVPGQKNTGTSTTLAFLYPDEDKGPIIWAKGPMSRDNADKLAAVAAAPLPGRFAEAWVEENKTLNKNGAPSVEYWVCSPNYAAISQLRHEDGEIPFEIVQWNTKSGDHRSQRLMTWLPRRSHLPGLVGLSMADFCTGDRDRAKLLKSLCQRTRAAYIRILLSRYIYGISDSAPRNTIFDLRGLPPGKTATDWIKGLEPKEQAGLLISIDFDKRVGSKDTGYAGLVWKTAVEKKHAKDVASYLLRLCKTYASNLAAEYAAVDRAPLSPDAQKRLDAVIAFLEKGADPSADYPEPEVEPEPAANALGFIEEPVAGRPSGTILGKIPSSLCAEVERLVGAPCKKELTTGLVASMLQKGFRSGDPELGPRLLTLGVLLFRWIDEHVEATPRQSIQTFILGRVLISMAEDMAASREAVGATIATFAWSIKKMPVQKPAEPLESWLDRRKAFITALIRRAMTISSMTTARLRPASIGSVSGVFPKCPKGRAQIDVRPAAGGEVPETVATVFGEYDFKKPWKFNAERVAERLETVAVGPAVEPEVSNVLVQCILGAAVMMGIMKNTLLRQDRPRAKLCERNEPHVFLWYAVAVVCDPELHPLADMKKVPTRAEGVEGTVLSADLIAAALDQHCGAKSLGFHPGETMADDLSLRCGGEDASPIRAWWAALNPIYAAARAQANAAAGSKRKHTGASDVPPKKQYV